MLRSEVGIFISQRKYILDLLTEVGMLDCKPADTPIIMNHGLQTLEEAKLVDLPLSHSARLSICSRSCKKIHAHTSRTTYGSSVQNFEISKENP